MTSTSAEPAPLGAYSHVRRIGPFAQISGQLALDASGSVVDGGIEDQTTACLERISTLLASLPATWADVLTVRVYLADDDYFEAFDRVYSAYVSKPYPARITVGAQLAPGALIEVDVLVVIPDTSLYATQHAT